MRPTVRLNTHDLLSHQISYLTLGSLRLRSYNVRLEHRQQRLILGPPATPHPGRDWKRCKSVSQAESKMMNDRLRTLVMDGVANAAVGLRTGDDGARSNEMVEAAMAGGILPRWRLVLDEDEIMGGMGPQNLRTIFREMLKLDEEEDENMPNRVPNGVNAGVCLMVDDGVMDSLLHEREGGGRILSGF